MIIANDAFSHNFAVSGHESRPRSSGGGRTSTTGLHAFVSPDGIRRNTCAGAHLTGGAAFHNLCSGPRRNVLPLLFPHLRGWRPLGEPHHLDGLPELDRGHAHDLRRHAREHLYTNQTQPYHRAPICVATPPGSCRGARSSDAMAGRMSAHSSYVSDCSDTVFMTSRGGTAYDRTFMEVSCAGWPGKLDLAHQLHLLRDHSTGGNVSFYISATTRSRRITFSASNCASMGPRCTRDTTAASSSPGPSFTGKRLEINYATSAAGSLWAELQQPDGTPIPGFTKDECDEIIGDQVDRIVTWNGAADVSALSGAPVRLRFVMKDADLFAIRFRP